MIPETNIWRRQWKRRWRSVRRLQRDLDMEEMSGMAIMECRDMIWRELGVNAASVGGIASPFFDDLIGAMVQKIKFMAGALAVSNGTAYTNIATPAAATQTGVWINTNTTTGTADQWLTWAGADDITVAAPLRIPPEIKLNDGQARKIKLADGTLIDVKADGSFEIIDKDAKVTYRACRIRDFNTFLNASDRLEEFIRFCGKQGVRQDQMLELPVKLFVAWLAMEAAAADQEPAPDIPLIPDLRKEARPRCEQCRRFLSQTRAKMSYCSPKCFERKFAAIAA